MLLLPLLGLIYYITFFENKKYAKTHDMKLCKQICNKGGKQYLLMEFPCFFGGGATTTGVGLPPRRPLGGRDGGEDETEVPEEVDEGAVLRGEDDELQVL